jgi:hypothetical protein
MSVKVLWLLWGFFRQGYSRFYHQLKQSRPNVESFFRHLTPFRSCRRYSLSDYSECSGC